MLKQLLNQNLIIKINKKEQLKINNKDFMWLNLSQIKKLNLIDGVVNPFVKTILFMIQQKFSLLISIVVEIANNYYNKKIQCIYQ